MMPETCEVGFKEWAGVCAALKSGRQTIILRKGGIAESSGPGLFEPEHSTFWLYPTRLHESQQGLREVPPPDPQIAAIPSGQVPISTLAIARTVGRIDDEARLDALREFHIWTDETVHKRFHYRTLGLWVLALRAYRRDTPYGIDVTPEQEGCKSWVPLGRAFETLGMKPVLDDPTWASLNKRLESVLERPD